MSDSVRGDATVFIFFQSPSDQRGRLWVAGTETRRNRLGNLFIEPILNTEARNAKAWKYELALIATRRFATEGFVPPGYSAGITLMASDSSPAITGLESIPTTREDKRVPMHYKGLLAAPGHNVREGIECWYVRFPGQSIESIRGNSPEEAVDRVFERNLQNLAEKYDAPPPALPEQPAPQKKNTYQGRLRPGAFRLAADLLLRSTTGRKSQTPSVRFFSPHWVRSTRRNTTIPSWKPSTPS